MRPTDWSDEEVRVIVGDYLDMLADESAGIAYSKTHHRRALFARLKGRSEKAIEYKHANVSAALHELGRRHIDGYKPRSHYQRKLLEEVRLQLKLREEV